MELGRGAAVGSQEPIQSTKKTDSMSLAITLEDFPDLQAKAQATLMFQQLATTVALRECARLIGNDRKAMDDQFRAEQEIIRGINRMFDGEERRYLIQTATKKGLDAARRVQRNTEEPCSTEDQPDSAAASTATAEN